MPEAPEVRLVVDSLQEIINWNIIDFIIYPNSKFKNDLENSSKSTLKIFKWHLQWKLPLTIKSINCHGKFIYFEFTNDRYLFNSLGMTGTWSFIKEKHTAIEFKLEKNNETQSIYFNDMRHFGNISFGNRSDLDKKISSLGPDMLSNPPTCDDFVKIARLSNHQNICVWLMNQANIAGVGNYIKSESLHRSLISPLSNISDISNEQLYNLFNSILAVMIESYNVKGCSLRDYKDARGAKGNFAEKLQVYSKKYWNKYKVTKIKTPDGRSSFYCPEWLEINKN